MLFITELKVYVHGNLKKLTFKQPSLNFQQIAALIKIVI